MKTVFIVQMPDHLFCTEAESIQEIAFVFKDAYEKALPNKGKKCMCRCGTHFSAYGLDFAFKDFEHPHYPGFFMSGDPLNKSFKERWAIPLNDWIKSNLRKDNGKKNDHLLQ